MSFKDVLKKLFTTEAHAARALSTDPLQAFRYRVSISGLPGAGEIGFQKVGGFSREVAVVEYFENMYEHAHKLPGRESFSEITFEKGMFEDTVFVDEYMKVLGTDKNNVRHEVTIQILNRWGEPVRTICLQEAWFSKYEHNDLDSTSDDVLIETLTVQFEDMIIAKGGSI